MTRVKILEEVCKLRTNPSFKILKTETWTASKKYYTMLVKLLLKARGLFNTPRPHKDKTTMSILQIHLKYVKVNTNSNDTPFSYPIKKKTCPTFTSFYQNLLG